MKEINKEPLPKGGNLTDDIIEVELLAPARNAEVAVAAINHGADAVYMGASSHGARQQASNSISDIRGVVEYAHRFGVKVYVTVNTIIYDEELAGVEKLVWELYGIGVDALIVQTDICGYGAVGNEASADCPACLYSMRHTDA